MKETDEVPTAHVWSNWATSVVASPARMVKPRTRRELAEVLRGARTPVRTVGSGHSFVPLCATDQHMLRLDGLQGVITIDAERRRVTLHAGTKLWRIGEAVRSFGLAMPSLGDIDRQSLAGALATGTHGTGRSVRNLSSQMVGARLMLASGDEHEISLERDPGELLGARVSLGALGVVTEITLECVPAFRLLERMWHLPFEQATAEMEERFQRHRHFELFYFPQRDRCALKTLDPTDRARFRSSDWSSDQFRGERIDWSDRVFPSPRDTKFREIEFSVPRAAGPECLRELRRLMRTHHADVAWPLEYREVAADDAWLSPAHGRDVVAISAHQGAELPHEAFFANVERVFRSFGGRPHWGKIHSLTATELAPLYPRFGDFVALVRRLDPEGRFRNPYLRELLGV